MTKQDMKSIGISVLEDIQRTIDANAIIAGGWARDLVIDEAPVPKDIDVWFWSQRSVADVHAQLKELYPDAERTASLVAEPGTLAYSYARAIFKFNINGADIDFILVPEPVTFESIVGRFDFNVCQAGYDGRSFRFTDNFLTGYEEQALALTDAAYDRPDLGRIVHDRLPKMRKKFPSWLEGEMPKVAPLPSSAGKIGFSAVYFDD